MDRYFDADGARLRYRDTGSGPAIMLVHGWTLDLEMWNPQVERLRDRFRLVRLDRRGHGLSTGTTAPGHDSADLAALCDGLGLDRVAVIAMSQGTRCALAFAAAAPDTVRALVLEGAPSFDPLTATSDLPLAHLSTLLRTQGIEAFRREWGGQAAMQLRTRDPAMHRLLADMLRRYDGRDLLSAPVDNTTTEALVRLSDITAPALILNGESDLDSRSHAAGYLCRTLSHAQRSQIPDAGHLPNLDNPEDYAERCRTFLSQQLLDARWR